MPQTQQYKVQAPDGKMITLEGPAGASEEEVIRQAQALYKPPSTGPQGFADRDMNNIQPATAPAKKPPSTFDTALKYSGLPALAEVGKGAVKQIGGDLMTLLEKINPNATIALPGLGKAKVSVHGVWPEDIDKAATASNPAQSAGKGAAQVAEFFLPSGAVGRGVKAIEGATAASQLPGWIKTALNLGGKAGLEAGAAGAVTAAQTGGDPEAMKTAAGVAGAIPIAGKVLEPVANALKSALSTKIPGRLIESIIKPSKKLKSFGREPGQEIAVQGLKANTLDGLGKEVTARMQVAGAAIDTKLALPVNAAKAVDVADAINAPIDAAIRTAKADGNAGLVTRLEAYRAGQFTERLGVPVSPSHSISPLATARLKREIGKGFRWSEDVIEGTLNDVRQEIYRNLNTLVDTAVPGVKSMNASYANLLNASKAIESRLDAVSKLNLVGLTETAAATGAAMAAAVASGDISTAGIMGLVGGAAAKGARASSTATSTRLAARLAKLSPQERTALAKVIVPWTKNIGLAIASDQQQTQKPPQ